MAAHSSYSFASPDFPGDACVVLVLVESHPDMANYWPDLKEYYLPVILGALQEGTPDTPIHVYWQMTADPDNLQPTYSNSYTNIMDLPFDAVVPLSLASLSRAVDTVHAVELVGRATRHLLVIAATPPHDPARFLASESHSPDAATREFVMTTLRQERIRLHMVLSASPRLQALRDFYSHLLRVQINVEVPAWFQVDSRKFTVHLAARSAASESGDGAAPLQTHGAASLVPRSGPVTPTSTAAALPYASPSPPGASPQGQGVASTSPARRATRHKGKDAVVPTMDPQGPGLVNYLKQVHGLTKRKGVASKGGKRAPAGEPSRTHSRPILPRLELPVAGLAVPLGPERSPTKPAQGAAPPGPPPQHAGTAVQSQVPTMGVPAALAMTPPADQRRLPGRAWPWIQPVPVTAPASVPNLSPTANAALRNLTRLAPRAPLPGAPGPRAGSSQVPMHHAGAYADALGSSPSPVATMAPPRRQDPYQQYALESSSPPQQLQGPSSSPPYHPAVAVPYATESPSPPYQASLAHDAIPHTPVYANGAYYTNAYPYAISPHNSDHSNPSPPLPSPAMSAPAHSHGAHVAHGVHVGHPQGAHAQVHARGDTSEDQPFIVTPEYEALANARFAAAVRSGAVHANMTPSMLSPAAASPSAGYFASAPAHAPHAAPGMPAAPAGLPAPEYAYAPHDAHFAGDPAQHAHYY
ncbi:hypothetical protein PsYK624_122720 [Phanerochaete sordida]|uniref:Uncharacterized protein n=1 Tax=Phanerochaete sordida TaxID=48140 RepID=A0A9P3GMC4_9APHY|nr:hypothetical protein PsYK624_122720 [Phanerochaete sordida]